MIVQLKKISISPVGVLMIVSELLIGVFVFLWLQSEFNSEKMTLQKNLFEQFAAAKSRVMDSVISKNLITPILNDPNEFKIHSIKNADGLPAHDSIKLMTMDSRLIVHGHDSLRMIIESGNDSFRSRNSNVEVRVLSDSNDRLLYQGVKMFIAKVSGPHGEENFFNRYLESGDTAMLKNYFKENLEQNHLEVKAVWINDHPVKELPLPMFYYESQFFEHPFGVQIEQYNGFLLRKILPQILFALLLLSITSAAFLLSFRSLRNQLRLAALKDDFISNMSHELKTPVATVKVAIEAIQQMDPVEKRETIKEYLGMASHELIRLDLLVDKVMNSVLMDNGKQAFRFERVNFKLLIEQALKTMELYLRQRNAKVKFSSDADEVMAAADAVLVQGILYNLIDNSLKYGKDEPEISIHLSETSSDVIIEFSDNGTGIPEEYIDKVFEKFLRVPTGNKHNVKGYGLGLNYVAQVMKQHHGSVLVKNLPQGGCEFTLKFPKQ